MKRDADDAADTLRVVVFTTASSGYTSRLAFSCSILVKESGKMGCDISIRLGEPLGKSKASFLAASDVGESKADACGASVRSPHCRKWCTADVPVDGVGMGL
jgi:hypothetical protein